MPDAVLAARQQFAVTIMFHYLCSGCRS